MNEFPSPDAESHATLLNFFSCPCPDTLSPLTSVGDIDSGPPMPLVGAIPLKSMGVEAIRSDCEFLRSVISGAISTDTESHTMSLVLFSFSSPIPSTRPRQQHLENNRISRSRYEFLRSVILGPPLIGAESSIA